MRPPSSIVGTTPLGFMSRYHFWSLPPYCSPTFSRSYLSPHSSAHHSTFMTLIEFARPQIFISYSPIAVAPSVAEGPLFRLPQKEVPPLRFAPVGMTKLAQCAAAQ